MYFKLLIWACPAAAPSLPAHYTGFSIAAAGRAITASPRSAAQSLYGYQLASLYKVAARYYI